MWKSKEERKKSLPVVTISISTTHPKFIVSTHMLQLQFCYGITAVTFRFVDHMLNISDWNMYYVQNVMTEISMLAALKHLHEPI